MCIFNPLPAHLRDSIQQTKGVNSIYYCRSVDNYCFNKPTCSYQMRGQYHDH